MNKYWYTNTFVVICFFLVSWDLIGNLQQETFVGFIIIETCLS